MPEVPTETKESNLLGLDKRVALALGFKPTVTWAIFNADESALMIDFEREAAAIKWWDEHPSVHAEHHIGELEQFEPYSTNIEAAMRIVEKMREQGWKAYLSNNSILSPFCVQGWYCEFVYLDGNNARLIKEDGATLPEAICLAALKALETNQS